MPTLPGADGRALLLYDGACGLCDRTVQFILRHDRAGRFCFAPLQAPAVRALVTEFGFDPDAVDSVVLVDERGEASRESTAALRTLARLGWPWRLGAVALALPALLRDPFYRFIARRRLRWFGAADACRLPSPGDRARFLA
ncbi:MAG: DCC1-like thiol-disulfide oxidoreductase family protein [Planctomycetota bacterium]